MWYHYHMKEGGFQRAAELACRAEQGGIGTLSEKLLHRTLKYWYEPDDGKHEVPVGGFFADILNADGVTEIQTGSFYHIDRKLGVFLKEYPVTLVCPVVRRRTIIYIDPVTGETGRPRLSPKKGRVEDVFRELVHVLKRLSDPNLIVAVPLVDAEEYRVRREAKKKYRDKGYDRAELVPKELVSETVFVTREDWLGLLPEGADGFTVKELAGALELDPRTAQAMCASLASAGALTRQRTGKSYVYTRAKSGDR